VASNKGASPSMLVNFGDIKAVVGFYQKIVTLTVKNGGL